MLALAEIVPLEHRSERRREYHAAHFTRGERAEWGTAHRRGVRRVKITKSALPLSVTNHPARGDRPDSRSPAVHSRIGAGAAEYAAPGAGARGAAARLSCSHAHITRTFRISRSPAPPRRESPLGDLWAARRMRRRQPLDPPTRHRAHAGAGWSFPDLPPRGPLPVYAVLDALQDPRPPHARGAAGGLSFLLQTPGHSPSVPPGRVMLKQARSRKAPDVPWQTPCRLGEADSCNEFLEAWVALQRFVSRIDVQVDEAARPRLVRALE